VDFTANQQAKQPISQPTKQPKKPYIQTSLHPKPGRGLAESNWIRPRAWDEGMSGCMVSLAGWLVG